MKYLIVNADDVLLSPGITRGALQAYKEGIVSSVSVVCNFDPRSEELDALKSENNLGVGIHLNCVSGPPVSRPRDIPSLVDYDGQFYSHNRFAVRSALGLIRLNELKREFSAQISRFYGWGLKPVHLDVHHHMQVFPSVAVSLEDMAIRFHIPWIRLPSVADSGSIGITGILRSRELPGFLLGRCLGSSISHIRRRGLNSAHRLYGVLETGLLDFFLLYQLLDQLPSGINEIICHPGECDGILKQRSSLNMERERELHALLNPGLKRLVQEKQIELTHYGRL